jgi:hypothetical protein
MSDQESLHDQIRLRILMVILLGAISALILLVSEVPHCSLPHLTLTERHIQSGAAKLHYYDEQADLRVSQLAPPLSGQGLSGEDVHLDTMPSRPIAVLFAEGCSECLSRRAQALLRATTLSKDTVIMIVADGQPEKAVVLAKTLEIVAQREVKVIIDDNGMLAYRYNVAWFPRIYVVDSNGKIEYVQPLESTRALTPGSSSYSDDQGNPI